MSTKDSVVTILMAITAVVAITLLVGFLPYYGS